MRALPIIVALMLCVGGVATDARAADVASPPAGLMWNKTGLPAVFPLQVKTLPGRDHVLTLLDVKTGEEALAAYIRGGAFFRVLVPPGVYRLRFVSGKHWQGEEALFGQGADTEVFELRHPLEFETRGLGIKAGHIVDLRGRGTEARITDQRICQAFRPDFPRAKVPVREGSRAVGPDFQAPQRGNLRARYCG